MIVAFFRELFHFNGEYVAQISWFSIAAGKTRGGHYHLSTRETFIVLEGEVDLIQARPPLLSQTEQPKWSHRHLIQSEIATDIGPLIHAFYSHHGAKVLALSDRHFNPNNSDTYQNMSGLLEYIDYKIRTNYIDGIQR